MRILVCGGRDWTDAVRAFEALDAAHKRRTITLLIHGACPSGADKIADFWAFSHGIERLPFPADWKRYGRGAGMIRNQQMIDEGKPDAVIAFPGNNGTADMIAKAQAAGLLVWRPYK